MSATVMHFPDAHALVPQAEPVGVDVEIVIPVYNEQAALAASIRTLHDHLTSSFPFTWRIVIADNASTDATPRVAAALATDLSGVRAVRLEQKGRGRALRATWAASTATVVAYMDVDLSTDLRALLPLVAPLISGHSDVAIGTRLANGARVTRGAKRECISRTYNHILRNLLRARFTDAQCGFKAVRRDALALLLPQIEDDAWFFDTELLVLAQRYGLRLHEVPVDWVDDPDSSVDIVATAMADLRGVARLLADAAPARFAAVGVVSTLAYAVLFLLLRGPLGSGAANALALASTAVANTAANRRLTFGVRGRSGAGGDHAVGLGVFAIGFALTSLALGVLNTLDPSPSRWLELSVLVAASLGATITRYVALKTWLFARHGRRELSASPQAITPVSSPVEPTI